MWDRVLQVLSGTRRFSLLLKALKAFGLGAILSLYVIIAIAVGVIGSSRAVMVAMSDSGIVVCVDFSRHGVLALFVLGGIVSVIA